MGWTYTYKPKGMSVREFFEERFNYSGEDGSYGRVLDCAVVNLRTAYIAYETGSAQGNRQVAAIVCDLGYKPNDYCNFGYKDMDETMGPYRYECPERILKLLTPTNHEWAKEWREKCWENTRAKKARPGLKKGMVIRFDSPVVFRSGRREDTFRVEDPRRLVFADKWGIRYKISRRTVNRGFQVLEGFPSGRETA